MTTETLLTDEEIITIGQQARAVEPGENGYILPVTFARAIEQAVLQSPEVQAWRKDAERLNWIEGQFGADITCGSHNEWWVDWAEGYVEAISMRGAIDQARRTEV